MGRITVGSFDFTESSILAHIYAGALRAHDYDVELKLNLGSREVVAPAAEQGQIDMYLGYAASEVEFITPGAVTESATLDATIDALRRALAAKELTALEPAPAVNSNAFAVTRATAQKYGLRTLSDLARVSGELSLGGPPECPNRPFCLAGLERVYGMAFREFKSLDAGGILSKDALRTGDADVVLVFSSDSSVLSSEIVVLEDDRHLQAADNVVPVIRTAVVTDAVRSILDRVSAVLTTEDLVRLNKRAEDEDVAALADGWLRSQGVIGSAN